MANPYAHHARKTGHAKMRALGGRVHSDKAADKSMIHKAMAAHDKQQHAGHHTDLKAAGMARGGRLDKTRRDKGGIHKKSKINVMAPAVPAVDPGIGGSPVAPPPTAMPPPGMSSGPVPNIPGMKKGGKTKMYARGGAVGGHKYIKMDAGAISGEGRLEKKRKYPKLHH